MNYEDNSREGAGVAKRGGLKILWLSAYAGSNPAPRIFSFFLNRRLTHILTCLSQRKTYKHNIYIFAHIEHSIRGGIPMVTITLAVPEEMKKRLDSFPEMNWSAVAREAFEQRLEDMAFLRRFRERSTLTEEDALRMGAEVNKKLAQRYKGLAKKRRV